MAISQGRSTDDFSKMDSKIKRYSKPLPPLPQTPLPPQKKKYSKILIISQNSSSVPAGIRSEVSSSENQWLTNEATNPSTRLQPILDRAIYNWYSNNVQALTSEMHALQLDQLSEQILFLFDCVWGTLQSNADTNLGAKFELQLNCRYVFLIRWQIEFVWTSCSSAVRANDG